MKIKSIILTQFVGFLLLATSVATAQTSKGTWLPGSSAAVSHNLDGEVGNISLGLNPAAGYFVADRLMLGLGISASYSQSDPFKISGFGAQVFGRYYFRQAQGPWAFFGTANVGWNQTRFTYNEETQKNNHYVLSGGVGTDYFITPTIGIEGILRYIASFNDNFTVQDLVLDISPQFFLPACGTMDSSEVVPAIGKGAVQFDLAGQIGLYDLSEARVFNFSIRPELKYFITDHIAAGAGLQIAFGDANRIVNPDLYVRYYPLSNAIRFQPFVEVNPQFRLQFADTGDNRYNFNLTAGAGFDYFMTRNVALTGKMFYNGRRLDDEKPQKINLLQFDLGFEFFLSSLKFRQ